MPSNPFPPLCSDGTWKMMLVVFTLDQAIAEVKEKYGSFGIDIVETKKLPWNSVNWNNVGINPKEAKERRDEGMELFLVTFRPAHKGVGV
jgi:hypothetical protein